MNKTIEDQLNMLTKTLDYQVDGSISKDFSKSFSEIIFFKNNKDAKDMSEKTFVFEDYIVKPFKGFDFHTKFNKGIAPPDKTMQGYIDRETDKMYYLKVRTFDNSKLWEGWCPKKSVRIEN